MNEDLEVHRLAQANEIPFEEAERIIAMTHVDDEKLTSERLQEMLAGLEGEIADFDAEYGKNIIGDEYERGTCDTPREEALQTRINTLRQVVPILRHALSVPLRPAETERGEVPLTASMLADVFGCVWNAAIGTAHRQQSDIGIASIIAESFGAMAARLTELASPIPDGVVSDEQVERLNEILDDDAPNKWVWKSFETQDEWLREKILPLLRELTKALQPSGSVK